MILKWIQSGAKHDDNVVSIRGGNDKKSGDSKLLDVAHEAMSKKQKDLDTLVKTGWPVARRNQFKGRVKKKVWDVVSEEFDEVNKNMIEEITERVVEASEADPFYKRIFSRD